MSELLRVRDGNAELRIREDRAIKSLSELGEADFLFNYHEDIAKRELYHLNKVAQELHIKI